MRELFPQSENHPNEIKLRATSQGEIRNEMGQVVGSVIDAPTTHTPEPWIVIMIPAPRHDASKPFDMTLPTAQPAIMQAESVAPLFMGEPDPRFVAAVGCESPRDGWTPEDKANAARIVACVNGCAGLNPAAVPGLLAACCEALSLVEWAAENSVGMHASMMESAKHIRAAISKARGETTAEDIERRR